MLYLEIEAQSYIVHKPFEPTVYIHNRKSVCVQNRGSNLTTQAHTPCVHVLCVCMGEKSMCMTVSNNAQAGFCPGQHEWWLGYRQKVYEM